MNKVWEFKKGDVPNEYIRKHYKSNRIINKQLL